MKKIITFLFAFLLSAFAVSAGTDGALSAFNNNTVVAGYAIEGSALNFELVSVATDADAETILFKADINKSIDIDGVGVVSYGTNVTPASGASIINISYAVTTGADPTIFTLVDTILDSNINSTKEIIEAEANFSKLSLTSSDYLWVLVTLSDIEATANSGLSYEYDGDFGTNISKTASGAFELGLREWIDQSGGGTGCCQFRDACYDSMTIQDCQLKMFPGGDHASNPQLYVSWYGGTSCSAVGACTPVCCQTGSCGSVAALRLECVIDKDGTAIGDGEQCTSCDKCKEDATCQASSGECIGTPKDCSGNEGDCTINHRCDTNDGSCISDPKTCSGCDECKDGTCKSKCGSCQTCSGTSCVPSTDPCCLDPSSCVPEFKNNKTKVILVSAAVVLVIVALMLRKK